MLLRALSIMLIAACGSCTTADDFQFLDGDIIFHTSRSSQSQALRRALGSEYTHMGLIFHDDGEVYVYEAVGPVKSTPLDDWIRRGVDGRFVVRRLSDRSELLSDEAISRLKRMARQYEGKPYDSYFEWSDDRIYCSELVWKIFQEALGLEIGELERFGDFDLSDPLVAEKLAERFGDSVPIDEIVISPASMFESHMLTTAHEH